MLMTFSLFYWGCCLSICAQTALFLLLWPVYKLISTLWYLCSFIKAAQATEVMVLSHNLVRIMVDGT